MVLIRPAIPSVVLFGAQEFTCIPPNRAPLLELPCDEQSLPRALYRRLPHDQPQLRAPVDVAVLATDTHPVSAFAPTDCCCVTRTTLHLARKRVTRADVLMSELHFY